MSATHIKHKDKKVLYWKKLFIIYIYIYILDHTSKYKFKLYSHAHIYLLSVTKTIIYTFGNELFYLSW